MKRDENRNKTQKSNSTVTECLNLANDDQTADLIIPTGCAGETKLY